MTLLARLRGRASSDGSDAGVDRPAPVPRCPSGWETGPPDFVGVGAQRAGTTRWFRLIAEHPEISRAPDSVKELHYFDQFYGGGWDAGAVARYREYFPRAPGCKTGEWTPMYCSAPWVAPLLAEAAPQTRLMIVLRDPVERYLSGLQLARKVATRRGTSLSRYAPLESFARGLYQGQLQRLLDHFSREQLLVLQYERCVQQPAVELERTFAFLGLRETSFRPDLERHPRRQVEKPDFDERTRRAFIGAYEADVSALAERFGELDLALWPNFAHLAR